MKGIRLTTLGFVLVFVGILGVAAQDAAAQQPVPVTFVVDAGTVNGPVTLQVNVYPTYRDDSGRVRYRDPLFDRVNLNRDRTSGKVRLELETDLQYQVTVDYLTPTGDPDPAFVYAPPADMGFKAMDPTGGSVPLVLPLRKTPRSENRAVFFDISYFDGGYDLAVYQGPAQVGSD